MFSPHNSSSSSLGDDLSASAPPEEVAQVQVDIPQECQSDSSEDLFKKDFDNVILNNNINNKIAES